MNERLNIGPEIRELKLGSTFTPNSKKAFHTIKYDFKPASVDLNKVASLDVGSNNQVTVTVPNLESSGVPHTVFKGNQRKYTKECIIIFDKKTGVVTLEKLNHNIQVKKTRTETTNKNVNPPPLPTQKLENNTQRTSSKTRVSTGIRKNNIIGYVPRNNLQGSPSTVTNHKSPQTTAPAWNANNAQSTLPSIPLIEVDDDIRGGPSSSSSSLNAIASGSNINSMNHYNYQNNRNSTSGSSSGGKKTSSSSSSSTSNYNKKYQNFSKSGLSSSSSTVSTSHAAAAAAATTSTITANAGPSDKLLESAAAAIEQEIGVLSSSDSSSESDSSGSGSDSDDSDDNETQSHGITSGTSITAHKTKSENNSQQSYANGTFPELLHNDLQLSSESNSSSSDDSDDSGDDDD